MSSMHKLELKEFRNKMWNSFMFNKPWYNNLMVNKRLKGTQNYILKFKNKKIYLYTKNLNKPISFSPPSILKFNLKSNLIKLK